jgi:hypothetical protein
MSYSTSVGSRWKRAATVRLHNVLYDLLDANAKAKESSSLEATSKLLKPKMWRHGSARRPAAWPLGRSRSSTSSWRHTTRPLQEAVKFMRKMEPQLISLSIFGRLLRNTLSSGRCRKKCHLRPILVLKLEADLLQRQREERRDRRRQPAGEVGEEEHKLTGGGFTGGRSAGADPSGERRRAPSEQVAHQVECHLRLEALRMDWRGHGNYDSGRQKGAMVG